MSLLIGSNVVAELKVERIRGAPGVGSSRVTFDLSIVPMAGVPSRTAKLIDLRGDLFLEATPTGRLPLAELHPTGVPQCPTWDGQISALPFAISADLDRYRLESLERIRNGGDIRIAFELRGILATADGPLLCHAIQSHPLKRGDWADVLQQMGKARTVFVEVPFPDAFTSPDLAKAIDSLDSAGAARLRGNWKEAVGQCRVSLESITTALGEKKDDDADVKRFLESMGALKSRDKVTRLRVIRRALESICSPPHHGDALAQGFEWDRVDATSAIGMTAAILQRYMSWSEANE